MKKILLLGVLIFLMSEAFSQEKKDTLVPFSPCVQEIYVPNSFNGNGDGINDIFRPIMTGKPETYSFQIFNCWGEVIFETKDVNEGWNGSYKGNSVQTDTYVWMLKITCTGSEEKYALTGHITLLR